MGDAKWVKVEVNMFDDTKLKIIDNMPDRDSIQYMWTRFLVLGGKINCGGYFYLTDGIPYTIKTFAIEFNRSIEEVKNAIKVLKKLEMIEFTEDKVFKIKNWEKHQNVEGLERLRNENNRRVAKHRAKKREDKLKNEEEANNNVLEIEDNNKTIENNIDEINDKVNNFSNGKDSENAADIIDDNSNDDCNVKNNDENNVIGSNNSNTKSNDGISAIGSDENNVNCNVTCNDDNSNCNITVMEQNKKEIKDKKKIKIKRESNNNYIKNKGPSYGKESKSSTLSKSGNFKNSQIAYREADNHGDFEEGNKTSGTQSVNSKALEILMHYEKLTGIPGVFNMGSIALAIDMHGEKFVKMAINKALELNKKDMPYINGILKNWRREGYPKDDVEVKKDGSRSIGKSNETDKNEFTGFKPKESRKLTEEQRKRAEENLI